MPRRTLALAIVTVLPASGCSWIFITRAPDAVVAPDYPIDCTSSQAAPILDTVCSVYWSSLTILALGVSTCRSSSPGESLCVASDASRAGAVALFGGLAAVCGFSAASGYGNSSRCEQMKELNGACIAGDREACQQLRPGWTPSAPPGSYWQTRPPTVPALSQRPPAPPGSGAPRGEVSRSADYWASVAAAAR